MVAQYHIILCLCDVSQSGNFFKVFLTISRLGDVAKKKNGSSAGETITGKEQLGFAK